MIMAHMQISMADQIDVNELPSLSGHFGPVLFGQAEPSGKWRNHWRHPVYPGHEPARPAATAALALKAGPAIATIGIARHTGMLWTLCTFWNK